MTSASRQRTSGTSENAWRRVTELELCADRTTSTPKQFQCLFKILFFTLFPSKVAKKFKQSP